MKTGFIHGYANKPLKKYYSYHGILRDCLIQPEADPFEDHDLHLPGARWEVIYEVYNTADQVYFLDYKIEDFFPAKINDWCPEKHFDGKIRHYFCELEIWDGTFIIGWSMDMNGITPCKVWSSAGQWQYFYKSYKALIWAGSAHLIWIFQWVPNSHFKVWRSSDGDLPDYDPVPIQEYHIP